MRMKAKDLLVTLRQRILSGDLPPGGRLPTKLELCDHYGASGGTVQKVLDALADEGFIHSRGCLGTFVREQPPHLARFGMVFSTPSGSNIWTRVFTDVAAALGRREERWLSCYYNCWPGSPGLQELERDVERGRLAALLFFTSPIMLMESRALEQPGLARVFVGPESKRPDIPTLRLSPSHPQAIERFVANGRRRLAVITTFNLYQGGIRDILGCARDRGLETQRRWVHYFDPKTDITARAVCELMMTLPKNNRPDAVYITDDHLVHEATLGLADSGIAVPDDVEVVAHANFPQPEPASVPVTYLGFDLADVLNRALALVDRQLAGKTVPAEASVDPIFQPS